MAVVRNGSVGCSDVLSRGDQTRLGTGSIRFMVSGVSKEATQTSCGENALAIWKSDQLGTGCELYSVHHRGAGIYADFISSCDKRRQRNSIVIEWGGRVALSELFAMG